MASTYSPNLRIELIATGEQSGTWGSTTNTNLGTLIETAISGYDSVVVAGDQALTAANGTADQSRNMVIEFTGAIAANYNIFIPPAEKVYIFKNSTTSVTPYTLTISASTTLNGTTPTGGTTVTIPQGKTMIVFCDANNVKEALDRVNGNLSVGGTLSSTGNLSTGGTATITGAASAASLTLTGTPLSVSNGGTGVTSITAGTIPRGNGTSPLSPASAADIVANIGSTAVQNATNATNAINATSATTATNIAGGAANQIPYNTGAGATSFLTAPTGGSQYLRYSGSAFEWGTLPSSGVLSVGTTAPLTNTGSSSSPVIAIDSTTGVGPTLGGTGQITYATGDMLYASGANTLAKRAIGTTSQALIVSAGVPTWGTVPVAGGGTGATTAAGALTNLGAYAASNPNGYTSNTGTVTSVSSGAGMNFTGFTGSGTITLGTPSTLTTSTTNSVSGTTHTHAVTFPNTITSVNGSSSGAITIQAAKAWVNFDGTGTSPIAPRSSFNVSSITKSATGRYTLNFTSSIGSTTYSAVGSAMQGSAAASNDNMTFGPYSFGLTALDFQTTDATNNTFLDCANICVQVFG